MAGKEFTTKGGAKLFVSHATFEDGLALFKAVNKVYIDKDLFGNTKESVSLILFGDQEVYASFLRCAGKATYNGKHVDPDLFGNTDKGDAASREIIEIFDVIVSFNTSRFFPAASSASSTPPPAA